MSPHLYDKKDNFSILFITKEDYIGLTQHKAENSIRRAIQ